MIKFGKKKKASAESKRDKLRRGTIEVAKEFDKWLKARDEHRNDKQTVTVKGIFAGAMV